MLSLSHESWSVFHTVNDRMSICCHSNCPFVGISDCLAVCLAVCHSDGKSIGLSDCLLSVFPPVYLSFFRLSIDRFFWLFVGRSVWLSSGQSFLMSIVCLSDWLLLVFLLVSHLTERYTSLSVSYEALVTLTLIRPWCIDTAGVRVTVEITDLAFVNICMDNHIRFEALHGWISISSRFAVTPCVYLNYRKAEVQVLKRTLSHILAGYSLSFN